MGSGHSHDGSEHGHSHSHGEQGGHAHDDSKMLTAAVSGGWAVAKLTAHLSAADGNELDIFIADKSGNPIATSLRSFRVKVTNDATGAEEFAQFATAPADERPANEPADRCSHFVAKTPWLDASATYSASVNVFTIQGEQFNSEWRSFLLSKFAHHHD